MEVRYHPEAESELADLPRGERIAMANAVEKLRSLGLRLPFPHQSAVRGVRNLRELRPRAGASPWRAFYRRIRNDFVIGGIGPEAEVDQRAYDAAVQRAMERLREVVA